MQQGYSIIDIHSHILPGLDDGPHNIDDSIDLIKNAYKYGIKSFIATPHYSKKYPIYTKNEVVKLKNTLEIKIKEEISKDIKIYIGQEILYSSDFIEELNQGRLITINDSRYILVEFNVSDSYYEINKAVREINMCGFRPIIAHIERYEALNDITKLEEIVNAGALLQINYSSINGNIFDKKASFCRKALKDRAIQFLGTDMHNIAERSPNIVTALKWLDKNLEVDYVEKLIGGNAFKIINGESILI